MSTKNTALILTLVILSGIYVYYFTELFNKPQIAISPRVRVSPPRRGAAEELQVSFSFDSKYKLTQVKVVSLPELETNKYARAFWHMISDTNSAPTKGIVYGQSIPGMKPKVPKMKAEPLQPATKYRLFVEAGKLTGQADFEMPARRAGQ